MTLYATEGTEQIALRMVFSTDIFDGATVAAMLARFVVLLTAIVEDPDRKVSSLPLLTDAERVSRHAPSVPRALPKAFARFERADVESTIPQRFEKQVEAYPEHIAVKTRRHEWTYRQLDKEATKVARRIQASAGDSDTRVGLLFESDAPLLAGILGALKAGQTYVPLDPSNPRDRLAYMLKHSEATILLTDDANLPFARELAGASVEVFNIEDAGTFEKPFECVHQTSPDSIAYILYTSGSTGVPKGVVQSHRNVLHFMRVYTNNVGIHHSDRLSLLSSYGFDGAVMDIFGALLNGATLVPARLMDEGLEGALTWIRNECVSVFHSTPTVFRQLLGSHAPGGELEHVRAVVLGGEEALTSDLELFKIRFSQEAILVNGLGPSESTVTLQHFMNRDAVNTRTSLPVGLPVEDTEVVLLDAGGSLTDIYGEIAICSPHVALGYWRDEEKTEAVFRTEPDKAGRRVYRTGDLGRRLPDGTLEFVGRKDLQVKIRGFRIELGEVESVIGSHPGVEECAVLARFDAGGSTRLVAYVQTPATHEAVVPGLRAFLKQKLPEYMMPAAFVVQSSLPLTANGKLDRDALPDVEAQPEAGVEFVPPRTPVERKTAELWMELLGGDRVGVFDDFFSLGGHSLLAMRLISRIRNSFEIELPLRVLFESPTLAGMAGHVEAAMGGGAEAKRRLPSIVPVGRDGDPPLSFAQQRMWILDQLEPGSSTYNVPGAVELKGPLHLASLEQAIDAIVTRHEVLRSTFRRSPTGEPKQVIGEPRARRLPVTDLGSLSRDDAENAVSRLLLSEAEDPFDLTTGPLLRVSVLRLAPERHIVVFTMHHIVSDAWSTGVLIRELSELYQALVTGHSSLLPPLEIQYADYASWQRSWLDGEVLKTQLAYWERQLEGAPDQLDLPVDRPRGSDVTHNGAREEFVLPGRLVAPLVLLARGEGTTLFVTLLAAFQALLSRYTGQDDIVVGTPISGRSGAETEPLIGFFVNTLVLRSRVAPTATFRDFLGDVHETVLEATAHQDIPFERLVDELQSTRGVGHTPLFQVAFVLQNAPRETLAMSELTLSNRPMETRSAKFDWSVSLIETGDQVFGHFDYNTDLFDAETIRGFSGHYQNLLAAVVADPARSISEIEILSDADRTRLLVEWNDTETEYPRDASIQALFEKQVERTPDAIALVAEVDQFTYRELNRQANRLARHLAASGVRAETAVGVYMDRAADMVIAQLAVLKCGSVYVPMDPDYPLQRLSFLAEDAGISVLLSVEVPSEGFVGEDVRVIALDNSREAISSLNSENPVSHSDPDSLAYVIYTSGSTGTPKGVEVPHRGVLRLLFGGGYAKLGDDVVISHLSSPTFDASTFEVWAPLLHGGRCVLYPERVPTPRKLAAEIRKHGLNTMWLTSALFNAVVDEAPGFLTGLDQLLIGGEALSLNHVRRALATLPSTKIINGYGPTESTTFTCCYPVPDSLEADGRSVPIGRPIGNTEVYILDTTMRPVPQGIPGELRIGGDGLARGYLDRPDLTAERFVPNPYATEPGRRVYRTGDLARYLRDGNVEFLGRADHQVKIRGFRIELGEIESTLDSLDGVRNAVVLDREDVPGDRRLVAYLVAESPRGFSINEIRSALRSRLPGYMVPATFVMLDELPLSPNGKVDRRALPAPERTWKDQPEWGDVADVSHLPSTQAEVSIARIWQDVLLLDDISVDDKFFDLGGHSLNAIQVMTRMEGELGFSVEFNDLIFQTLRQIAASCEQPSR